jgi:hypothetical protein
MSRLHIGFLHWFTHLLAFLSQSVSAMAGPLLGTMFIVNIICWCGGVAMETAEG